MRFIKLAECAVSHEYEGGGACKDVRVRPTRQCAEVMSSTRLVFKPTAQGFFIAAEGGAEQRSRIKALRLLFAVHPAGAGYSSYTETGSGCGRGGLFVLTNRGADTRGFRLHEGDAVSAAEWRERHKDMFNPHYPDAELRRDGPLAVIDLSMEEALKPDAAGAFSPRAYTVRFAARKVVWRYHVQAAKPPTEPVAIVNAPCAFEPANATLEPNQPQVFASKEPIPLSRRGVRGIQLAKEIDHGDDSDRFELIVNDLPNASASCASEGGAVDIPIYI